MIRTVRREVGGLIWMSREGEVDSGVQSGKSSSRLGRNTNSGTYRIFRMRWVDARPSASAGATSSKRCGEAPIARP